MAADTGRDTWRAGRRAVVVLAAIVVLASCSSAPGDGAALPPGGAPGGARATAAPAAVDLSRWSQVQGTDGRGYIADEQGRARLWRGFNIKTRDMAADVTDDLLEAGRVRGFGLIRLSIYWDQFEPTRGSYDEAYLASVAAALDRAQAHGFLVILDFHQDVFGPAFGDHGVPLWATRTDGIPYTKHDVWLENYLEPAVQTAFEHLYDDPDLRQAQLDAWTMVARRFGAHGAVLGYDLLNEPFGKLRPGENLLAAAARVQAEQLTPMYQRLADAVHGVDPDGWVFFHPPNVASLGVPVALGKVEGERLALFPHFYDPNIETATYQPGGQISGFDPGFFDRYRAALWPYVERYGYPTLFGEWGLAHPDRPGMDEFVRRSLALMDELGSGWTVFNWCKGDGYCPIDESGNDRPNIGQIVQPYARAIAGRPTSFRWDPGARVLTVVFVDGAATGPSEIVVPVSSYAGGFEVETTDGDAARVESDAPAGIVRVATPATGGAHTICVKPKGAPAGCAAPS